MNKKTKDIIFLLFILSFILDTNANKSFNSIHHLTYQPQFHQQSLGRSSSSFSTTTSSRSNPIASILFGFVLGPILFFTAFIVIYYNEKKAALDYNRIQLAGQICQQVNPNDQNVTNTTNQKLIHISGKSSTNNTIGDRLSGISSGNSIKIIRKVQVKQWRTTEENSNNNRTINYNLSWQSSNQPQAQGRSNDPSNWFIKRQDILNQNVSIGQFQMSDSQKKLCNKAETLYPNKQNAINVQRSCNRMNNPIVQGQYIIFPSPNGGSYEDHGALRISYHRCPTGPISVMAKSVRGTFVPFPIAAYQNNGVIEKNELPGCCIISKCYAQLLKPIQQIDFVQEQQMSSNALIDKRLQDTVCYARVIRVVTFFMIVFGIWLFFSPITTILGYIPFVGGFISSIVGWVILLAAIIIAIPLYLIALSISWLCFHPKVGLILLGIALLIIGVIIALNIFGKSHQSSEQLNHLIKAFHLKFV